MSRESANVCGEYDREFGSDDKTSFFTRYEYVRTDILPEDRSVLIGLDRYEYFYHWRNQIVDYPVYGIVVSYEDCYDRKFSFHVCGRDCKNSTRKVERLSSRQADLVRFYFFHEMARKCNYDEVRAREFACFKMKSAKFGNDRRSNDDAAKLRQRRSFSV